MTTGGPPDPAGETRRPHRASAMRRVLQAAEVLASRQASLRDFLRPGFSVTSTRMVARLKAHVPEVRTILDAGANVGQFALAASRAYPEATVIAFEPLPEPAKVLRKRASSRMTVHQCALGREPGTVTLLENAYSHVSSILPIDPRNRHPNYDAAKVRPIDVQQARLDHLVTVADLVPPVLLKLDVQGYEKEVLGGAQGIIQSIDFLIVEVAFAELYEGQPLFEELHRVVLDAGFALVAPLGLQEGAEGMVIEMDGLYRRSRPS